MLDRQITQEKETERQKGRNTPADMYTVGRSYALISNGLSRRAGSLADCFGTTGSPTPSAYFRREYITGVAVFCRDEVSLRNTRLPPSFYLRCSQMSTPGQPTNSVFYIRRGLRSQSKCKSFSIKSDANVLFSIGISPWKNLVATS